MKKTISSCHYAWPLLALNLAAALPLQAQTPATGGSTDTPDDVVVLSPFNVEDSSVAKYQAAEATSAARIRVSLFDASSSINVLTSQFLKDVGSSNLVDSMQYVSGIVNSTKPGSSGADRIEIRGFQIDGRVLDGFTTYGTTTHQDPFVLDRVEVVKGPNAIISPGGQPGGTVNFAVKKAEFADFGSAVLQVGQYDADKLSLDINRKLSDTVAIRLVASGTRGEGYYHDYNHEYVFVPSITWNITKTSQLKVYAVLDNHVTQNYLGLPIDPAASSTHDAGILHGLSTSSNPYDQDDTAHETRQDYFILYTAQIIDGLSVRLAAHAMQNDSWYVQFNNSPAAVGGIPGPGSNNVNPFTGLYDPTQIWFQTGTNLTGKYTYAAPFSSAPAPTPSAVFNRGELSQASLINQYDVQNDYVYQWKRKFFDSSTTAGFAFDDVYYPWISLAGTKAPFNIYPPYAYTPIIAGAKSQDSLTTYSNVQEYLREDIALFDRKVVLNGGVSHDVYHSKFYDNLLHASNGTTTPDTFYSAGVSVQPVKDVSVYYGYSQSAGYSFPGPAVGSTISPLQVAKQNEAGARYRFLDGRATVSAAYFFITQSNVQVFNPANLTYPPPNPLLPNLASDRVARGWEYEGNLAITKEISLVANFTKFKNRDFYGAPFRGTAEKSGAAFLNYAPTSGLLRTISTGLGVSYVGRRPGDVPRSGYALGAVVNGQQVINQPTFWLPGYTRVDLTVADQLSKQWTWKVNVENLLNEKYLAGSLDRNRVYPGLPINVYSSITYSF